MARKSRGFTLIELMVSVAIIALLVAILLPSLARAKERGKTVLCAANMKQIGQMVRTFAAQHENRGPGGGARGYPDNDGSSVAWDEVLGMELLGYTGVDENPGNGGSTGSGGLSQRFGGTPSLRTLSCPNYQPLLPPSANSYNCCWAYNTDASGGTESDPTHTKGGVTVADPYYFISFGKPIYPPDSVSSEFSTQPPGGSMMTAGAMGKYWLGAKLDRFDGGQFLLIEQDHANPTTQGTSSSMLSSGGVTIGGPGAPFIYTTADAEFSFRHPYTKFANFLCFDGHVELHSPHDNIAGGNHYNIDPDQ